MTDTRRLGTFLRGMRAVRRFSSEPISDAVLQEILDAGRWTGSSKNTQPWHLIVIRSRETLQTLAGCGPFAGHLAGAQAAIALVMENGRQQFDEGRLAQNLMLAAWAHGVGSCIATVWSDRAAAALDVLGAPPDRVLRTILSLGYPADERARFLSAAPGAATIPIGRRPLAEVVHHERYGRRSPA
jgi:nitroreductase